MTVFIAIAGCFWLIASLLHVASLALVTVRLRAARRPVAPRSVGTLVSIVRPVNGLDAYAAVSLRSGFLLVDPAYEIIFCAHSASDPVVPLIRDLMAEYPSVPSKLLFGTAEISGNPKLNNIAKSWPAIEGAWIIFCDGNIVLPPDYIARLLAAWGDGVGAVSAVHIGERPDGFWAEVECAFLNPYQARWHMAAAAAGFSFAHGKTMLMRYRDLELAGGIEALASDVAEDMAVTKLVRARGLKVAPSFHPVVQPLGARSALEVFERQARWARLRRLSIPVEFLPEVLSGALLPVIAAGVLAHVAHWPVPGPMLAQIVFWYGAELLFVGLAGWHLSWRAVPAALIRDVTIPWLWAYAWVGREFRWGGKPVYGPEGTGTAAHRKSKAPGALD